VEADVLPDPVYMSDELHELAGETQIMFVAVELEVFAGYTVYGGGGDGDEVDKFLLVDDKLLLSPSIAELVAALPSGGTHAFVGDQRFVEFCRVVKQIALLQPDGDPSAKLWRYDFAGTLSAIREREIFWPPHSGMAVDCIGAAVDLGRQLGKGSPGYQLARYGPLDELYEALWEDPPDEDVDLLACEAAMVKLIGWIESLVKRC
jgi:hypothetical protein